MPKYFNVNGACNPSMHYMVDLTSRLEEISKMVDRGSYFTINRGRQYGKTTTLMSLAVYLQKKYEVVFLDFQNLDSTAFDDVPSFVKALATTLLFTVDDFPGDVQERLSAFQNGTATITSLQVLFQVFSLWCKKSERPIVLLIDEVDTATNNQVFLDFLAQLRARYLARQLKPTFQSVILAGVHDVRNIKRKIRPDEEHKENSPWNISADFDVNMAFTAEEISGMLSEYENDYHTGMDISEISTAIFDYTSGYPVLVSRICKLIDEKLSGTEDFPDQHAAWTKDGVVRAVGIILMESSPLFGSLIEKVDRYPELRNMLYDILMNGARISYNPDLASIRLAEMYGFVRREGTEAVIANRIFETRLYNYFLSSEKERKSEMYRLGEQTVCELKIWRGDAYNERGEDQLSDYLDYYHLDKGYMLSFCFNKDKKIGLHEVKVGSKTLVEAVV